VQGYHADLDGRPLPRRSALGESGGGGLRNAQGEQGSAERAGHRLSLPFPDRRREPDKPKKCKFQSFGSEFSPKGNYRVSQ
jgi:hypothetical protein